MDLSKLKLPALLVLTLLGAAAGAGATSAGLKKDVETATSTNRVQDAEIKEQHKEIQELKERVVRTETNTVHILKSLDRLEEHFGTKR